MQWLRDAAQRISRGSGRLTLLIARRITRCSVDRLRAWGSGIQQWLGAASGFDWLLRVAILVAVGLVAREALLAVAGGLAARIGTVAGSLLGWASLVWIVVTYRIGREDWQPRDKQMSGAAPAVEQDPEHDMGVAEPPAGPPPVSPVALVAAVRDIGTPHAQLKPIAEHLGTTTDAVRAAAAGLGWPVKDVRMQGRSASAGLRWDEAPSPLPGDPSPGVVGAGQHADDNDDDTAQASFVTVPDDTNPVRTHVVWRQKVT
jgi:hypothetical protein